MGNENSLSLTAVRKVQEYRGMRKRPGEGFFLVGRDPECIRKFLNGWCKGNPKKWVFARFDPLARPGKPVPLPEYNVEVVLFDKEPEGLMPFYELWQEGYREKAKLEMNPAITNSLASAISKAMMLGGFLKGVGFDYAGLASGGYDD